MSFVTEDGFWIESENGEEFIVPSPGFLHDKASAERYKKFIDEFNAIGSLTITAEQIKTFMENKFDNTNLME